MLRADPPPAAQVWLERQLHAAELQRLRLEAQHAEQTIADLQAVLRAALAPQPRPDPADAPAEADAGPAGPAAGAAGTSGSAGAGAAGRPCPRAPAPGPGEQGPLGLPDLTLNPLWQPDPPVAPGAGKPPGCRAADGRQAARASAAADAGGRGAGGRRAGGYHPRAAQRLAAWRAARCLRAWLRCAQAARLAAAQARPLRTLACEVGRIY